MTEPAYDLIIRGGRVATTTDTFEADVAISGETIAAIGHGLGPAKREIDARGKYVLPGGVDSQIIEPDGTCRLSARYALQVAEGTVYVENNGIRRVPAQYHDQLFADDMRFFSDIPPEAIYFRTVPTFEVDAPALSWLTTSLFICAGGRTQDGVMLDFYQVG